MKMSNTEGMTHFCSAILADFYCEVLQFLDIHDIGRLSGVNKDVRKLSYSSGRWHVPALYLPMLLQPHSLLKVHHRKVRFIDVKGLDVLLSRSTQKLMDLKAEMQANRGKSPKIVGIEATKEVLSVILGIDPPDPDTREESNTFLTATQEPMLNVWDNALELIDMMTKLPDLTLRFGRYRFEFQQKWNQLEDCSREIQSWRIQKFQPPMQAVLTWTKLIIAIVLTKITLGPELESPFCKAPKEGKRPSVNFYDFSPTQLLNLNQLSADNTRGCLTPLWACAGSVKLRQRVVDGDSLASNAVPSDVTVRNNLGTMLGIQLQPNNSIPSPRNPEESIVGWRIASSWEAGLATLGIGKFENVTHGTVIKGLINPETLGKLDLEEIQRVIGLSSPKFSVELELCGPSIAEMKATFGRKPDRPSGRDIRIDTDEKVVGLSRRSLKQRKDDDASSVGSALPSDFHFSKLRVLETEVLKTDLNSVHVLTPFRKPRRRHRTTWGRQHCESLIRSVWPKKNEFPPICTELLQAEERKRTSAQGISLHHKNRTHGMSKLRLATTLTLMDKLGIARSSSRCKEQLREPLPNLDKSGVDHRFTPSVNKFVRSGGRFSLLSGDSDGDDGRISTLGGCVGRQGPPGVSLMAPDLLKTDIPQAARTHGAPFSRAKNPTRTC